ncbi:MAG: HD domain-containing protein [bacterium]|nr:HD domain-containing protein [bacterium]
MVFQVKDNIRIKIPDGANYIIGTLQAAGFEAYAVGGCVRDSILGREPQDWDITTSAEPAQVKELFPHTVDTGLQHGTVTVLRNRTGYEVTTYRIDGTYEDGRHPKEVTFTPDLREDLRRRDFTVNAMAYNGEEGLIDLYDGLKDLEDGVIRCVGNAVERFGEDALRMLRAVRFSAQLGYRIEEETKEGIRLLAPALRNISAERIRAELVKTLTSPHPDYLREAYRLGITKVFLPEFDRAMETAQNHPHHKYGVGEHILHSLLEVRPDSVLRLTMLLHDIGKPAVQTTDEAGITHFHGHAAVSAELARQILRRLKFDNDTTAAVCRLVMYHDYGNDTDPTMRVVRHALNRIGEDAFPALFEVKYADICAQSDYLRKEKLERLEAWRNVYAEVIRQKQCVTLRELAVSGADLIAAGMKPGKELGGTLGRLLELVLEEPSLNTKEKLLEEVKKMME